MTHTRITRNPKVMMGKPCIKGTRVTVERILEDAADGMGLEDILKSYEHISEDDVRAAFAYAAEYLRHEGLVAAE